VGFGNEAMDGHDANGQPMQSERGMAEMIRHQIEKELDEVIEMIKQGESVQGTQQNEEEGQEEEQKGDEESKRNGVDKSDTKLDSIDGDSFDNKP
jgi:hypothetical protein